MPRPRPLKPKAATPSPARAIPPSTRWCMQRYEAKKAKNFAEADRIRDELKAQGIEIVDTKDGANWKRV